MATSRKPLLPAWRPRSLRARQLLTASVVLLAFLALTGYVLYLAFVNVAGQLQRDRLHAYAIKYVADIEFFRSGDIYVPEVPPDPRFDRPGSGLYAVIISRDLRWESMSTRGPQLPDVDMLAPNQEEFRGPIKITNTDGTRGEVFRYGIGLTYVQESDSGGEIEIPYSVYIMEDEGTLARQIRLFRGALWTGLGISGLALLLFQLLILRWSLRPLDNVVDELKSVQRGQANRMSDQHPRELAPLTESINALIESERENLERQRNTMSDLAHSLKTPLAVLRTRLDGDASEAELREEVATQLRRMNDMVGYQLGRAASGGHKLFAAPVLIEPHAEQIVRGLEKIYAAKGVICEFEIDERARFHGEPGDLQELLGNLLENAFKWAKSRVLLTVQAGASSAGRRPGLILAVDDDGPGIPEDRIAHVLQRGVRGDERVQGHGIGLAIVQDIVRSYRGVLDVGRSTELSGARFEVTLPPGL